MHDFTHEFASEIVYELIEKKQFAHTTNIYSQGPFCLFMTKTSFIVMGSMCQEQIDPFVVSERSDVFHTKKTNLFSLVSFQFFLPCFISSECPDKLLFHRFRTQSFNVFHLIEAKHVHRFYSDGESKGLSPSQFHPKHVKRCIQY